MKPAQLWKAALLCVCLSAFSAAYSQSPGLAYFEAASQPNTDSTSFSVNYVLAVKEPALLDTLQLSFTDGAGNTLYAAGNTIAGWQAAHAHRTEDGILYLTVEAGSYPAPDSYTFTAVLKSAAGEPMVYTKP